MKKPITDSIFNFWNSFLDFGNLPDEGDNMVIPHNPSSGISEDEFYIFEYIGSGRIISVHDKYLGKIRSLIERDGYGFDKLKRGFENLTGKRSKILGPVISEYLFSTESLLEADPDAIGLKKEDEGSYEDFRKSCVDMEMKEVDMDFNDPTHKFFALIKEDRIVSLCNYSIDKATSIAHIGIVTPKRFSGNGYGKNLVNSVVLDILDNGLIPQYRVGKDNIVSQKIAKSLGFTPVIESFSLVGTKEDLV